MGGWERDGSKRISVGDGGARWIGCGGSSLCVRVRASRRRFVRLLHDPSRFNAESLVLTAEPSWFVMKRHAAFCGAYE